MISIILPCYKAENYLPNIVPDVLAQTYEDWELLIVSNGYSQERQLEVASSFSARDKRVKVMIINRGGVSIARNYGIEHAAGEWITFLDADDRINNNHLQLYADAVRRCNGNCDMTVGGITLVKGNSSELPIIGENKREFILNNSLMSIGVPWNKLYRASVIKNYKFETIYTYCEDLNFNLRLIKNIKEIAVFPLTGYRYVWGNSGNATSKYHPNRVQIDRENNILLKEVYRQCGLNEDEVKERIIKSKYLQAYFNVLNLFKTGCTLTLREKRQQINEIVFLDPDMPTASKYQSWQHQHPFVRAFTVGFRLHSPWLITLTFAAMFSVKRLLRRIRPC